MAPRRKYYHRLQRSFLFSTAFMLVFLGLGIVGYHLTCSFSWIDSLLNASMILSGMGPTNPITTNSGKIFASVYALLSGVVFISTVGVALAPIAHRIFHKFHLADEKSA
ncbi:MAG: hypothetical protein IPL65_14020 [Lewinellaceae bacterium]|nr:hypothetical protein [Lewinellaceae bacterium]